MKEDELVAADMTPIIIEGYQVQLLIEFVKHITKGPQEAHALLIATYMELSNMTRKDTPDKETIVKELTLSIMNYQEHIGSESKH